MKAQSIELYCLAIGLLVLRCCHRQKSSPRVTFPFQSINVNGKLLWERREAFPKDSKKCHLPDRKAASHASTDCAILELASWHQGSILLHLSSPQQYLLCVCACAAVCVFHLGLVSVSSRCPHYSMGIPSHSPVFCTDSA